MDSKQFRELIAPLLNNERDAHHGDVQYYSLSKLPEGAVEIEKSFIAKSEISGHSHAVCGDYKMFELDGRRFLAVGEDGATMNHVSNSMLTKEYFDENVQVKGHDHGPDTLAPGIYFVGIQNKIDPYKGTFERVRD